MTVTEDGARLDTEELGITRGDTWSLLHMMSAVTRSDLGQHEVMEMTSSWCSLKGLASL